MLKEKLASQGSMKKEVQTLHSHIRVLLINQGFFDREVSHLTDQHPKKVEKTNPIHERCYIALFREIVHEITGSLKANPSALTAGVPTKDQTLWEVLVYFRSKFKEQDNLLSSFLIPFLPNPLLT